MYLNSQLTDAVLQAATFLPVVPDDLALGLSALKARRDQEPPRDPEDALRAELEALFGPYAEEYARMIVEGQTPDTDKLNDALFVALLLALIGAASASALQRGAALGVGLSIDAINRQAVQWAQSYSYELVRGITETTRQAISSAVTTYARTPGMTVAQVAQLLEPTFGATRAGAIATTEITRAYSQASTIVQREQAAAGQVYAQQWITEAGACPICAPLHNSFEDVWRMVFPSGPPSHVNCRCWLALVRVT